MQKMLKSITALLASMAVANDTAKRRGAPRRVLVPADYDGDGKTDPGRFSPSAANGSSSSSASFAVPVSVRFGSDPSVGNIPIPADYDGDGKADLGVFRKSTGEWFILSSANGSLISVS